MKSPTDTRLEVTGRMRTQQECEPKTLNAIFINSFEIDLSKCL